MLESVCIDIMKLNIYLKPPCIIREFVPSAISLSMSIHVQIHQNKCSKKTLLNHGSVSIGMQFHNSTNGTLCIIAYLMQILVLASHVITPTEMCRSWLIKSKCAF